MEKSSVVLMVPQNKNLFGTKSLGLFLDPEMPSGNWMFLLGFVVLVICFVFIFVCAGQYVGS